MISYFLVLALIVIAPTLYLFDTRIQYSTKLKKALLSTAPVIAIFLIWDYFFTQIGVWSFNSDYVTGIKLFVLPIEEILFFPAVAFSMLFIWEVLKFILAKSEYKRGKSMVFVWVLLNLIFLLLNTDKMYTVTVTSANILTSIILINRGLKVINDQRFWIFITLSIIPFMFINSILTGVPIVSYSAEHFSGILVWTIPLEDFFYNISLLTLYVWFYEKNF